MENHEIVQFAEKVISSITNDINNSIYSDPEASLTVQWKRCEAFNASAISNSKPTEPPIHIIEINYGLVISLYQDIDDYCNYLESGLDQEIFDYFQKDHSAIKLLPPSFEPIEYRKNMFISALTWVYFHELAHLNQEHGYLLNKITNTFHYSKFEEFNLDKSQSLKGNIANLHHTLELAADFEAIKVCIAELIRHFNNHNNELKETIGTLVSGISCAVYKMHNLSMLDLKSEITGSHPSSIVRLEQILPQIWEHFDLLERHKLININMDRSELVQMVDMNARTAGFFWFRKRHIQPTDLVTFIHHGTINRAGGKEYLQSIINTWDAIKDEINENLRNKDKAFSILEFSDEYRDLVFER